MARRRGRGGQRVGAGRKPIPEDQRRRNRFLVSLTDAEYAALRERAKDLPLPTYVYRLIQAHLRPKKED